MSEHQQHAHTAEHNAQAEAADVTRTIHVPKNVANVEHKEVSFFFKKDKELGTKRETVKLNIPVLTIDGLVDVLQTGDAKQIDLVLSAVNEIIIGQARSQVNDDENISQETLKVNELTWEWIANLPQAERRGGGIAKETWEEFVKDYATVMAATAGKTAEQLDKHSQILLKKFLPVKSNKQVLKAFQTFLAQYAAGASQDSLEAFADCLEFLNRKIETLLQADESALLEAL